MKHHRKHGLFAWSMSAAQPLNGCGRNGERLAGYITGAASAVSIARSQPLPGVLWPGRRMSADADE